MKVPHQSKRDLGAINRKALEALNEADTSALTHFEQLESHFCIKNGSLQVARKVIEVDMAGGRVLKVHDILQPTGPRGEAEYNALLPAIWGEIVSTTLQNANIVAHYTAEGGLAEGWTSEHIDQLEERKLLHRQSITVPELLDTQAMIEFAKTVEPFNNGVPSLDGFSHWLVNTRFVRSYIANPHVAAAFNPTDAYYQYTRSELQPVET